MIDCLTLDGGHCTEAPLRPIGWLWAGPWLVCGRSLRTQEKAPGDLSRRPLSEATGGDS
jgi:hypothetical protein